MSHKKVLISNFLSLSSVQALNYILPLVTVPYLVRVLGPETYGLIAFAQAFIGYFGLLTDYGFNLSAPRKISVNRDDKEKISTIFSSIIILKMAFMALSFFMLCLLVFSIQRFREEWLLYMFTFCMLIGNVLFPSWLFQGMERMKQIAVLNILAKTIFTISIFVFIKSRTDYIYIPLINALGGMCIGLMSLHIIKKEFGIGIKIPSIDAMKHELKEGWHIFVSTIAISLYTISNTFILGLFTNNTIVGYYSAGEKIIRAALNLLGPLSQTIYPHISKLASESREAALNFLRNLIKLVSGITFVLSVSIFFLSSLMSDIILGHQYKDPSSTVIDIF